MDTTCSIEKVTLTGVTHAFSRCRRIVRTVPRRWLTRSIEHNFCCSMTRQTVIFCWSRTSQTARVTNHLVDDELSDSQIVVANILSIVVKSEVKAVIVVIPPAIDDLHYVQNISETQIFANNTITVVVVKEDVLAVLAYPDGTRTRPVVDKDGYKPDPDGVVIGTESTRQKVTEVSSIACCLGASP